MNERKLFLLLWWRSRFWRREAEEEALIAMDEVEEELCVYGAIVLLNCHVEGTKGVEVRSHKGILCSVSLCVI